MRTKHCLVAGLVAVTMLAGGALPAQAAATECPSGYECIWGDLSYQGIRLGEMNYMKLTGPVGALFNNKATSVASHGNVNCAKFWDNTDFTGASIYFTRPALGGIYRDPDLRNGGGYGSYNAQDWNDRIGSANWKSC